MARDVALHGIVLCLKQQIEQWKKTAKKRTPPAIRISFETRRLYGCATA